MQVQLCKKSIERMGTAMALFLSEIREREHTPVVRDCISRCQGCERGLAIATADGIPLQARDAGALLADLDALAATLE